MLNVRLSPQEQITIAQPNLKTPAQVRTYFAETHLGDALGNLVDINNLLKSLLWRLEVCVPDIKQALEDLDQLVAVVQEEGLRVQESLVQLSALHRNRQQHKITSNRAELERLEVERGGLRRRAGLVNGRLCQVNAAVKALDDLQASCMHEFQQQQTHCSKIRQLSTLAQSAHASYDILATMYHEQIK